MEPMEFFTSSEQASGQISGVFQTVRVETDAMPPIVELGRKLLAKAQAGDAEAVRELMKQGAPFTTDWLGTSAIHWACQLNHYDVAELLMKAGISKDARNKVDRTPLHVTAQEGHIKILKLLLAYGVDVDASDMLRMTPLHWAAENGHEECVKLLLEHGADPVAVNKFDKTPDQIAFENDRLDICHIIQEYAENPLRHVHRKEAKERQKQAAAAHKAALEQEKAGKNPIKLVSNGEKLLKTQGHEIKEVRILKLPKKRGQPKVIFENDLRLTNGFSAQEPKQTPHPLPIINQTQLPNNENTEKTLQLLQAHGITMLPADESTIVASAVQNGQKVMLTEAGKMALNLTERPISLKSPSSLPVKGLIKLPPDMLKGKKVITIRADQLINMKNERRVIIQTDKKFKSAVMENKMQPTTIQGKQGKLEVVVTKTTVNNKTQLTSSIVQKPVDPDPRTINIDGLLTDPELEEVSRLGETSHGDSTPGKATEMERIKSELEEMKRQMKMLQEQYQRKEKEAEEYKRIVDMLRSNQC